jgi:hypothetical protein
MRKYFQNYNIGPRGWTHAVKTVFRSQLTGSVDSATSIRVNVDQERIWRIPILDEKVFI